MPEQNCRFLGEQDASTAFSIMRDAQPHAWSFATLQSCLSHPYQAIGLYKGEQLTGFYIIHEVIAGQHKEWSLMEIVVASTHQGQGTGQTLLQDLLYRAQTSHVNEVWLEVRCSNANAIHIYRKFGFVDIDTRVGYYPTTEGREDGLVMCFYPKGQ